MWRILRQSYVELICGDDAAGMTEAEKNAAVDPHLRRLERDLALVMAAVEQAKGEAVGGVLAGLHASPAVDEEMLDQAVLFASRERKNG